MKLGENILNLRKKQGLSQEQLGEKVNVTRQTISNWELGETTPNPEQLKLLSKALNISVDELLDNDCTKSISNNNSKGIYMIFAGLILILVIALIGVLVLFFNERDKHIFKLNETTSKTTEGNTSKALGKDTFIRTYEVLEISKVVCSGDIVGCDDTTYDITLKQCKGETKKLQVSNISNISKVEKGKVYEFKFQPKVGEVYYEDTIINLFAFNQVVSITETNKSCSKQIQDSIKTRSD